MKIYFRLFNRHEYQLKTSSNKSSQKGFALAFVMFLLAILGLMSSAAISVVYNHSSEINVYKRSTDVYYGATLGLGLAMSHLSITGPGALVMTLRDTQSAYLVGAYNKKTGNYEDNHKKGDESCNSFPPYDPNDPNDPNNPAVYTTFRNCVCNWVGLTVESQDCIDFYVELGLKNAGATPVGYGINQFQAYYVQLKSTSQGLPTNLNYTLNTQPLIQSSVSLNVTSIQPAPYSN